MKDQHKPRKASPLGEPATVTMFQDAKGELHPCAFPGAKIVEVQPKPNQVSDFTNVKIAPGDVIHYHQPIPTVAQAQADATGEWTVEEGITVVGNGWRVQCMHPTGAQAIATAHNAALASERKKRKEAGEQYGHMASDYERDINRLQDQLADEEEAKLGWRKIAERQTTDAEQLREKVQTLVNALEQIDVQTVEPRCAEIANAALAKVKEGK